MKKLFLLLLALSFFGHGMAQNPFAELGYRPKVATLSGGKFNEFHDQDSVVRIGSVLFNVNSRRIAGFVEKDSVATETSYEADVVSRWMSPDPMANLRNWLSPYNFVQNNPLLRVDPDGKLDDYYNSLGQFLYRDTKTTDNIRIIDQSSFDAIAANYSSDVMDNMESSNLGLLQDLENNSVGINQANLSYEAASNVFTDILSKMDGVDMGKLYNGKVSIYNGYSVRGSSTPAGFNDPERSSGVANTAVKGATAFTGNATDGTIKVTVNFTYKRNTSLSTVSNVQNALGVHEFQGHGVKRFELGGGPHSKAYDLQMRHPSWNTVTPDFKRDMIIRRNSYLNRGN